jgi:hypothetical protein
MRISDQKDRTTRHPLKAKRGEWISLDELEHRDTVHVGLVGGSDLGSVSVRQAQSVLRFDRRPSYFSHAFIFTGRGGTVWECPLVGANPAHPDNNGVRKADADDYADPRPYPNRAHISFKFKSRKGRRMEVLRRARNPNASVERIDLWSLVTDWQPYVFDPQRYSNPLLEGLSHPAALFVHWALEAGGIDVSLGASEPLYTPEHIWAAANWWSEAYASDDFGVEITIRQKIGQKDCTYPPAPD